MRKHAYAIFQRKHNQRAILMKGGIFPRVGSGHHVPLLSSCCRGTLETVGSNGDQHLMLNPSNPELHTKLTWVSRGGTCSPRPVLLLLLHFSPSYLLKGLRDSFPYILDFENNLRWGEVLLTSGTNFKIRSNKYQLPTDQRKWRTCCRCSHDLFFAWKNGGISAPCCSLPMKDLWRSSTPPFISKGNGVRGSNI